VGVRAAVSTVVKAAVSMAAVGVTLAVAEMVVAE